MVLYCVRLKFEKSSQRWIIVGRECKTLLVEFFNSLEKIALSLEFNGEPNKTKHGLRQRLGRPTMNISAQGRKGMQRSITQREHHRQMIVDRQPDQPSRMKISTLYNQRSTAWLTGQSADLSLHRWAVNRTMVSKLHLEGGEQECANLMVNMQN